MLLNQFKSPLLLLLLSAVAVSYFVHDRSDALIILAIVLASALLGFWQERGAKNALQKLLAMVQVKASVLRDGRTVDVPLNEVVAGDVAILSGGDAVPADGLLIEAKDLFAEEASLTGESYPVEKSPAVLPEGTPLARRTNTLFMGTHVVSGSARLLVMATGPRTEIGRISERLKTASPETEFERGVRRFGALLMEITLVLLLIIFGVNVAMSRPVMDSFLFSLALAVGLTPQLLPVIISVNLAHGAKRMAAKQVIVKRLSSIENFGSMDVLCSDKTGTMTEGNVKVRSAVDGDGRDSEEVLLHAWINSTYETGFRNPIDQAIREHKTFDAGAWRKLDELPYDFHRKRLSVLAQSPDGVAKLITKGSTDRVLEICSQVQDPGKGPVPLDEGRRRSLNSLSDRFGDEGNRVLGVAYKILPAGAPLSPSDEKDMIFLGFVELFDPPKAGLRDTLRVLMGMGVTVKMISGDNRRVAAHVAGEVGLQKLQVLTGAEVNDLSPDALRKRVDDTDVFAEIEPPQKERILLALKRAGHVVGYMGDGINDAPALHAADVGISVESAVDVAREAADIVLLKPGLDVLVDGVREGRVTFANTLKYVYMATSANFGNMFSMAGASLFLPFLPLLPKQILLTNLLTDFPEMTIASDRVDPELVDKPRRWDIGSIRRFMGVFGLLSSVFDYLTFIVLLLFLHADARLFRTGWFVESVVSAALIVLVVRTRGPFLRSRPSRSLTLTTLGVVALTLLFPSTPLGKLFNFVPLPMSFYAAMGGICVLYIAAAEGMKIIFYGWAKGDFTPRDS